jgi:hypothetical protein
MREVSYAIVWFDLQDGGFENTDVRACISFCVCKRIILDRPIPGSWTFFNYLLAIRKNTAYKLMWWLHEVRYDTMYYYVVVGNSSSDVTSGALQV